jgi:hypothetical protein
LPYYVNAVNYLCRFRFKAINLIVQKQAQQLDAKDGNSPVFGNETVSLGIMKHKSLMIYGLM